MEKGKLRVFLLASLAFWETADAVHIEEASHSTETGPHQQLEVCDPNRDCAGPLFDDDWDENSDLACPY
jgi:hypothetical protein